MAHALGLSLRGYQNIERDEGLPGGESLLGFVRIGFNPTFILTGEGPMRLGEPGPQERAPAIDAEVFQVVDGKIRSILIEFKRTAPERTIFTEAIQFYNDLAALVPDLKNPTLVEAGMTIVGSKFRDKVMNTEYGSGKRSAS